MISWKGSVLFSLPLLLLACSSDEGSSVGPSNDSTGGNGSSSSVAVGSSGSVPLTASISGFSVQVSGDSAVISGIYTISDTSAAVTTKLLVNSVDLVWPTCNASYRGEGNSFNFLSGGCRVPAASLQTDSNAIHFVVLSPAGDTLVQAAGTVIIDDYSALVSESVLSLGAQNSAQGSSIDLDSWTVYTATALTAAVAPSVDLVLYYDPDEGMVLLSPTEAIAVSYLASKLVARPVETAIFPLSMTSEEFAAVQTVADLPDLSTINPVERVYVETGSVYLVATDKIDDEAAPGLYLLSVNSASSGASGTITVTAKHP